ncbi:MULTISPECIES: MbtH family protein [Kitasatospora]|uniref:MbtH family protein n=1 Tax=Kitasatospora cystarginea TaxID=58350 RepID=A0ABP5RQQ3_9ACTN
MLNPLDDPQGRFVVVTNDDGHHALWPEFSVVPAGWALVHGPSDRSSCLDYVNGHWTDMRPLSLVTQMAADC